MGGTSSGWLSGNVLFFGSVCRECIGGRLGCLSIQSRWVYYLGYGVPSAPSHVSSPAG